MIANKMDHIPNHLSNLSSILHAPKAYHNQSTLHYLNIFIILSILFVISYESLGTQIIQDDSEYDSIES